MTGGIVVAWSIRKGCFCGWVMRFGIYFCWFFSTNLISFISYKDTYHSFLPNPSWCEHFTVFSKEHRDQRCKVGFYLVNLIIQVNNLSFAAQFNNLLNLSN